MGSVEIRDVKIEEAHELQDLIELVAKACDSRFFYSDEIDYVYDALRHKHVLGAYYDSKLVGYGILYVPNTNEDNFGCLVGVSPKEMHLTCSLDDCAVHPQHRGKTIQKQLIKARVDLAKSLGYKHIYACVHPENLLSINNLVSNGLKYVTESDMGPVNPCSYYYKSFE